MPPLPPGMHVFYSNQVERLAAQLALDLALFRGEAGVWKPATLVVPNPNVKDYLRGAFAEAFGAVANLEFRYLEGFWQRYANVPLVDRTTLFSTLLSVLQDPQTRQDPNLQSLGRYLEGAPEDLKAVQLSGRLAQHYERMLLQRPDWIRAFDRGLAPRGIAPSSLEAWQRALWRRLRQAWKRLEQPPMPLADWLEHAAFAQAPFPEVVFLFGMSHMAPLFHHALAKVGTRVSVRLYLVNPCEEPWDQDPQWRPAFAPGAPPEGEDPFSLHQDRGELILQRWARPAREQLRLLSTLAQGEFLGRFVKPEAPTLLAHLQRRILRPELPPEALPGDAGASLRVLPCPSPRREADTVADLIWELVRQGGGDLHFGDIAVLVPTSEQSAYEAHLAAAFRSAHNLPWARAFGASRALEELVEACLLLLDLGGGDLTRAQLLRAARHPFIQARLGHDAASWGLLCDQAGILGRLDASETTGTYLQGGRWTWEEGLTRLALGRFMKDEAAVPELGPKGRPLGRPEAASLLALLDPLAADLRALAVGRHSFPAWQERLALFLRSYLEPDPSRAPEAEAAAFQKVRLQLEKLGQIQIEGLPPAKVDFQALRALARTTLEALLRDNSLPPGRGVQVSCYTPLRAIPFKAIFLMGLGEGLFPAPEQPDALDLVAANPRRAGDVSRPEQERQLFLEAVLCARAHLVCTYPSRNAVTGDALQPSPLVLDLEETLGPGLWRQVWGPEQPLHRHELSLFPDLDPAPPVPGHPALPIPSHSPAARQEAEARWIGQRLRGTIGQRDLPRRIAAMGGSARLRASLDHFLGGCGPLGTGHPHPPSHLRITLRDLRRWLECPVQGGVALRLGVTAPQTEEAAELEDYPLDSGPLEQWSLLRRAFWTWAAGRADLSATYDPLREVEEARAKVPIGPLSAGERQRHLALLERWAALAGSTQGLALHRFGSGLPLETQGLPIVDHPALTLPLAYPQGRVEVAVEGLGDPLRGEDFLLLSTGECTKDGPRAKARMESLRSWLSHLALCASGASGQRFVHLLSASKKGADAHWRLPLPSVPLEVAREQLRVWCQELLVEGVQKLLPLEALLESKPILDLAGWIADQKDPEEGRTLACFRGPVPRVKDLPVDDLDTGRQRLEAFLGLQGAWEQL